MDERTMERLQLAVQETELHGEQFLDVRAEMVYTDKQRQENREALTALRKLPSSCTHVSVTRPGGVIMHLPVLRATELLKQDQDELEARLDKLRQEQKRLMALLSDKGAGPQSVGPDMLAAMLNLKA